MKPTDERPSNIPWPPILLIAAIAVGIVLNLIYTIETGSGTAAQILQGIGIAAILLAILIYFLSAREMSRKKTTVNPTKPADHLVTSGPFSISRNPIYLANVIILIGLGLVLSNFWMFPVAIAFGYAAYKLAIDPEENHLEHKFGKAWRDYRKRVRRWI